MSRSIGIAAFAAMCLLVGGAAGEEAPAAFSVVSKHADGIDTMRFACRPAGENRLACNRATLSLGYYAWKKDDKTPQETRCRVTTGASGDETFEQGGENEWIRTELGRRCSAVIVTTIKGAADGFAYERVTRANLLSDPQCLYAHGAIGHSVRFVPHDSGDVMPIPCSNVVMEP